MSIDTESDQILEYERIFNFLDKNKKKKLSSNDVILALGSLGKACTLEEKLEIINGAKFYNLESFIEICKNKVEYNDIESNLISYFKTYESRKKPGYILKQKIYFLIKKFDFDKNIKDKKINELIKEVSNNNDNEYINIELLVKEFLIK